MGQSEELEETVAFTEKGFFIGHFVKLLVVCRSPTSVDDVRNLTLKAFGNIFTKIST